MHSLRQRYGGNLIHTYAGPNMVVINPLSTPSMYSEKVSFRWRRQAGVTQAFHSFLAKGKLENSSVILIEYTVLFKQFHSEMCFDYFRISENCVLNSTLHRTHIKMSWCKLIKLADHLSSLLICHEYK